jgi:DNA-binding PadR family transcriptional regulator
MSLSYAIMGLLAGHELSGYELGVRFRNSVEYFWHARAQQIYPELSRLETAGLIAGATRSRPGKGKRVYCLTERGRECLREWVISPSPLTLVKDEFLVKVWCYGVAEIEAARAALADQRAMHARRLATFRLAREQFPAGEAAGFAAAIFGSYLTLSVGIALEEAFIAWCDEVERTLVRRTVLLATPPCEPPLDALPGS